MCVTMYRMRPARLLIFSLAAPAAIALAAGCQTMAPAFDGPTLTVSELARDLARGPASYRGRTVRVCRGRLDRGLSATARKWQFSARGESWPHGASVMVKPCSAGGPRLDARGCLVGRIAREDGSLRELGPNEPRIVSDAIESETWLLHTDCGRQTDWP